MDDRLDGRRGVIGVLVIVLLVVVINKMIKK
jgi:hypothetical protein